MTGWHVFRKESYQPRSVVVWVLLALCGGSSWAAQTNASPGPARHEFITLTNIPAEKAKTLLGQLKLATASKLPGGNALLVTAEPTELQKAVAVLDLIDSRTEFGVLELGPATSRQIPSSVQIAAVARGLSLGTFTNPPQDKTKLRAIVDVHNGTLVAIAPAFQLKTIELAMAREREALSQKSASAPVLPQTLPVQPPTAREPAGLDTHADRIVGAARLTAMDSPQTIQTPALLESRFSGAAAEPATELKTEAQPPAPAAPAAEPVASAAPLAAGGTPAPAPSNAQPAEPLQPAPAGQPVAAEPKTAVPQPAVPTGSTLVMQTPVPAQPKPAAGMPQVQPATSPFRPAEAADGDKVLDLTLPDRMPVIYLLDLVNKYLGLSCVYNPEEVKGEVTLKLNGDLRGVVRVKDLYPLMEQSLRQLNLVTTRHGDVVAIAPVTRGLEIDPPLIDMSSASLKSGNTLVTCKFELKYIDTTAAKNLIEGMKLNTEPVAAIPEKHMVMVTSYAYRMARVEQLLRMIDQPGEPKKFRDKQLLHTMAKPLADKVKAMAEVMLESVTVTVAESTSTPTASAPPQMPGETEANYRVRLQAWRTQQAAQEAARRAQRAAAGLPASTETKPGVYLDADERTNRILMIGAEKQLAVIDQLVEALDVQQQELRVLQLYRIKHVDAADVAQKLFELSIISKTPDSYGYGSSGSRYPYGAGASRLTTQPLPGQPRPAMPTAPETQISPTTEVTEKGLVEEPQVVVVEATNSLLVNATTEQHAKIGNIIEFVDSETLTNEIPYKIYPLENSSPTSLSETLMKLIQETVEQQKEGGKIEKVVVNKDEKIKIVPDPNTYSLIVYANKRNQEWISNLISQLDKRRPQVLIDVTLVSITRNDKFDYDLNFVRSSPDLTSTSGITGVASTEKTLGKAIQTSAAGLTAFYGDKQIQALLDTMQSKTYGRVLAKPKLLVNDNEKGKVDNKETTYVETTSALPVASGVPGTTSGLVQTSTTWQNYDAGVTLEIMPHISEGDLLRLDIKLTRSDFGVMLGNRPPDKKTSEVETGVTLPNGATVILGGMLKMNQTKSGSGVPLLQDIPLLGGLFKSIHNSQIDENLYMFVKAEIIRPDDATGRGMKELEVLSERNRQAFEKHELEFQNAADWPGLKSKRVPPVKVLDAQ